jgi:uncharacterized OsmC-like protein
VATFTAETVSSGAQGRAIASIRTNHFVVDDPAGATGGPGEAPSAAELFLSGVTACAVLMLERLARAGDLPLEHVHAEMTADREPDTARDGIAVFEHARLSLTLRGLTQEQAGQLVEVFKGR